MACAVPRIAECPVCKMPMETKVCEWVEERGGDLFFFCGPGCRDSFLQSHSCCQEPKGWWGRYMQRLTRANEGQFGPSGPKCH